MGALVMAATLSVTACSSNTTTTAPAPAGTEQPTEQPPSEEGTPTGAAYPEGPYGVNVGQTLGDIEFVGHLRKETTGLATASELSTLKLSDVRAKAGEPKYAVIHLSAYWCGICRAALGDMVAAYPKEAAKAIFVDIMVEGSTPDDVATKANLDSWVKGLDIPFTVLRDPDSVQFRARGKLGQRKTAYLVELATMKILKKTTSDVSEILAGLKTLE